MKDQTRNLNPHKAAVAAMWLNGERYAAQSGGSMDFWDGLSESEKNTARRMVDEIYSAEPEMGIEEKYTLIEKGFKEIEKFIKP